MEVSLWKRPWTEAEAEAGVDMVLVLLVDDENDFLWIKQ